MQIAESANHRTIGTAGSLEDIEILQKEGFVTTYIEDSAPGTPAEATLHQRAEKRLHEVELEGVTSGWNGNRVAEVSISFSDVEAWNTRPSIRAGVGGVASPDVVHVATPSCAITIDELSLAS